MYEAFYGLSSKPFQLSPDPNFYYGSKQHRRAKAYLDYLYSEEAQEIAAKHALRPRNPAVLKKYSQTFKPIQLFTVNELFGSLEQAQKVHFNDGGQFDKLYTVK